MPNTIDATGLTIKTRAEIINEILNGADAVKGLYEIYGNSINVDPNTPDGNLINLFAQIAVDYNELIAAVYNNFDPDKATGINLDLRCGINGVVRQAGTKSTQPVTVTVSQALTLSGLDTNPDSPFTISDSVGNQFQLVTSYSFGGAGSANLTFQSSIIGAIAVSANTLTTIVTVQLGVTSVNNGILTGAIGTDEESDYALRIRRANSTAIGSKGFLAGLYGALGNVAGVTSVNVIENVGAHSIRCIVSGGTNADVANAIYVKRNAGIALVGSTTFAVTQPDLTLFTVAFDRPISQNLWIAFDVAAITGFVDPVVIRTKLLAQLRYNIGAAATTSALIALVQSFSPNAVVTVAGVSDDNITYVEQLAPTDVNYQFQIASARIIINGVPGA